MIIAMSRARSERLKKIISINKVERLDAFSAVLQDMDNRQEDLELLMVDSISPRYAYGAKEAIFRSVDLGAGGAATKAIGTIISASFGAKSREYIRLPRPFNILLDKLVDEAIDGNKEACNVMINSIPENTLYREIRKDQFRRIFEKSRRRKSAALATIAARLIKESPSPQVDACLRETLSKALQGNIPCQGVVKGVVKTKEGRVNVPALKATANLLTAEQQDSLLILATS
jgi:hypothetical protein